MITIFTIAREQLEILHMEYMKEFLKDEDEKKMNSGITILVFVLFFLWIFSEVKAISYKRKIDAYEYNYVILRDLYND